MQLGSGFCNNLTLQFFSGPRYGKNCRSDVAYLHQRPDDSGLWVHERKKKDLRISERYGFWIKRDLNRLGIAG